MYALIQKSDSKILKTSSEFTELAAEKPFYWVECPDNCTTAWTFSGEFEAPVPAVEVPVIPSIVDMAQARLALLQFGLLATVDAAIAQGSEADKIAWEFRATVKRDDPLVQNMKALLGLSEGNLDSLFTLAASL